MESIGRIALYFVFTAGAVIFLIVLSYFLGERHSARTGQQPYESGIEPIGSARVRFDVRFYLIAIFFVIFDLETAFVLIWAVALKQTGLSGFVEMLVFIGVLVIALIYLWRLGGLDTKMVNSK